MTNVVITTIREIIYQNLEVGVFIHRHNLTEKEAYEIEGALIDAYGGLTNIQGGHGNNDFGIMNIAQIVNKYEKEQLNEIPEKVILFKIKNEWIDFFMQEKNISERNKAVYETVRGNWIVGEKRNKANYVFAVNYGVIIGVYKNVEWKKSEEQPNRWRFTADKAEDIWDRYVDKIIPDDYRKKGTANPIQYTF